MCEQRRKGIGAACGKLSWGPAELQPVDQRGGKTQDRSSEDLLRPSDKRTTVITFVPFQGKAPSFSGPAPAESQARACARATGNPRLRCSAREGRETGVPCSPSPPRARCRDDRAGPWGRRAHTAPARGCSLHALGLSRRALGGEGKPLPPRMR